MRYFEIKLLILLIVSSLFITGCINPYNIPEGEGAYLKNRKELRGKSKYIYWFSSAVSSDEDKIFAPGITTAKYDAVYKIPSGEILLIFYAFYYPRSGEGTTVEEALSISFKYLFSPDARSRFSDITEMYEIIASVKINALKGNTYQINGKIENNKAYLWIEDDNGTKVSEMVQGRNTTSYGPLPNPPD